MAPDSSIQFADDNFPENPRDPSSPWKILIADDEPEIHTITQTVLNRYTFMGRPLKFLEAFSGEEAYGLIKSHPDTALILLDVSLEKSDSGLTLIQLIREKLGNKITQIVIRTGQPACAPEQRIIEKYSINDYRLKTELTSQKLNTVVTASLRAFHLNSSLQKELNEKKLLTAALKNNQQRLEDIAHTLGDRIWETDTKGRYTFFSENTADLPGHPSRDFLGQKLNILISPEKNQPALDKLQTCFKNRQPFSNVELVETRDRERWFLTTGKPFYDDSGNFLGFRGVDKDISMIKKAEKEKDALMNQLRRVQRLEALGTLAGGIAHDFNNILGAILGYTQLLQFEIEGNPKGAHYSEKILDGCQRAKNLIHQILDFSRHNPENSRQSRISITIVVKECLKLLKASIPSSIKIETSMEKDPGYVLADPSQIHQSVMNLCTNAFQAMENNQGVIRVTIKGQHLAFDDPARPSDLESGNYILLSVWDNGRGIDEDTLEKIFDPYFSTKRGRDGTGLGLSVVHGIATRCGGSITASSSPEEGTTFTLFFPQHKERKKKSEDGSLKIDSGIKGEGQVLFVDDEPMLSALGKSMLEKLGYTAVAVNSPEKALDLVKETPQAFNLVMTDMTMPDLSGTQLASRIKQIRPDLPIILVTGFSSISLAKEPDGSSIDALLPKPLSINAMAQTLNHFIQKS